MLPTVFQYFSHRITIGRCGNSANIIECAHQSNSSGLNSHLIRKHIGIPKRLFGNLRINIIASRFRSSIPHIVFQAGSHSPFIRQGITLIAFHRSHTENPVGIRVFSVPLGYTSPTTVMRHINHRRESPVYSRHTRLLGGNSASLFHQSGIPGTCLS